MLPPLPVMQRGEMPARANCVSSSGGLLTVLRGSCCALLCPRARLALPCSVLATQGCHWVSCAEGVAGTRSDVPSCPGNLLGQRRHLLTAPDSVSGTLAGKATISVPASCLQSSGGVKEGLGPGRALQRALASGHGEQRVVPGLLPCPGLRAQQAAGCAGCRGMEHLGGQVGPSAGCVLCAELGRAEQRAWHTLLSHLMPLAPTCRRVCTAPAQPLHWISSSLQQGRMWNASLLRVKEVSETLGCMQRVWAACSWRCAASSSRSLAG